jgi:hypothetical protein
MILEGIVTTVSREGNVNIAPMGPRVDIGMQRLLLRPYVTSHTYRNLKAHGEGVFHVTDDVSLLAHAAVGALDPLPGMSPASVVRGHVLENACRCYEFRVSSIDEREERIRIDAEVVHTRRMRDFFGFNRAKHAVVEAAILATRTDFLKLEDIESEFRKLALLVDKTGGDQEKEAFAFLQQYVARVAAAKRGPA